MVLLDLGLRTRNSLNTVQLIKKNYQVAKIIVMDLVPLQTDIYDFVQAGVSGFMLKDINVMEFLKTIRSVNNGSKDERSSTLNPVYGFGTNIRSLYRIAPRVIYNVAKLRLALECEYTSAAYGSDYNNFFIPSNTTKVANMRILLAVFYFF